MDVRRDPDPVRVGNGKPARRFRAVCHSQPGGVLPARLYKTIEAQRAWAQGVPEVPGGYFTSRHIDNAFRRVTYYWEDPKDTLTDYVYTINQEITGKRKEFGLPYVEQERGGKAS